MRWCVALGVLTFLYCGRTLALEDGLAWTPPMGWNSWNAFQTKIDEALIRSMVDAIAGNGMKAAGYQYVIIDAGWKAKRRDAANRLAADPERFPSGIQTLADYVHGKGLKFGLYTDAGSQDCVAGTPGSRGFEALDAATFAEWGVDYLKEDWCHTEGLDAKEAYAKMHDAIVATGYPMVFSVCEWGDKEPWKWAPKIPHLWRTTGDIMPAWDAGRETIDKPGGYPRGWTLILDAQPPLKSYAGPGHWNDPDVLVVGLPGLSLEEARAHFSLWSILAAPLICSCDVTRMTPQTAAILLNPEVIAVDQDALGIQGDRVVKQGTREVWTRPLRDGSLAVVLFNRSENADRISASSGDLQLDPERSFHVRDLWQRKDIGEFSGSFIAQVPGRGAVMVKISPKTNEKRQSLTPTAVDGHRPAEDTASVVAGANDMGYISLFSPESLKDWRQCGPGRFVVKDGVATGEGGMGLWWYSGRQFDDFILRGEFVQEQSIADSGVFLRFPDPGDDPWNAVHQGHEMEIGDPEPNNRAWRTGSIYPFCASGKANVKPVGQWNQYEITCIGHVYRVLINGEQVLNWTDPNERTLKGYIGLQNYNDGKTVRHRNFRIKPLP